MMKIDAQLVVLPLVVMVFIASGLVPLKVEANSSGAPIKKERRSDLVKVFNEVTAVTRVENNKSASQITAEKLMTVDNHKIIASDLAADRMMVTASNSANSPSYSYLPYLQVSGDLFFRAQESSAVVADLFIPLWHC